jgi:hypothetical protein
MNRACAHASACLLSCWCRGGLPVVHTVVRDRSSTEGRRLCSGRRRRRARVNLGYSVPLKVLLGHWQGACYDSEGRAFHSPAVGLLGPFHARALVCAQGLTLAARWSQAVTFAENFCSGSSKGALVSPRLGDRRAQSPCCRPRGPGTSSSGHAKLGRSRRGRHWQLRGESPAAKCAGQQHPTSGSVSQLFI